LRRLGLAQRIAALLDPAESLPAIGQGALALECRAGRADVIAALAPLSDAGTTTAATAERAFGRVLAGNCRTPLAAYATDRGGQLWLRGLVASRDGGQVLRGERCASARTVGEAAALGEALGAEFLQRGAAAMLADA
jgi:hydroxymethylbilane synthase